LAQAWLCVFSHLCHRQLPMSASPEQLTKVVAAATSESVPELCVSSCHEGASPLNITASMLSGRSFSFTVFDHDSMLQLRHGISAALGLEHRSTHLFHDGHDLSESDALTVGAAGLVDGSHLEVGVRSWTKPMQVPPHCCLTLEARKRYASSAFIVRYVIRVDVPNSEVRMEMWRKNDHDTYTFNTALGTCKGRRQHWMCGDTPSESQLGVSRLLADLMQDWLLQAMPVFAEADRFWKLPAEVEEADSTEVQGSARSPDLTQRRSARRIPRQQSKDFESARPNASPIVPGWFVAPSSGCTELVVNTSLSVITLLRVLVDAQGLPVRAAVFTECPNHDQVEEYDVALAVN